jgi:hypothetical protein
MHASFRMYTLSPTTHPSSRGPHGQHYIASFYAFKVLLSFNYGTQELQESEDSTGSTILQAFLPYTSFRPFLGDSMIQQRAVFFFW